MKRASDNRSNRSRINLQGFLLAGVFVSPISFWFFVLTSLAHPGLRGEVFLLNDMATLIGVTLLLTVVVTAFGLVPALLFGAVGLWVFEGWRAGRVFAPWIFATAGAGVALIYVGAALAVQQLSRTAGFVSAASPWVSFARTSQEGSLAGLQTLVWIMGCIIAAGAVAGLIYERSVRPSPKPGKVASIPPNDEQG